MPVRRPPLMATPPCPPCVPRLRHFIVESCTCSCSYAPFLFPCSLLRHVPYWGRTQAAMLGLEGYLLRLPSSLRATLVGPARLKVVPVVVGLCIHPSYRVARSVTLCGASCFGWHSRYLLGKHVWHSTGVHGGTPSPALQAGRQAACHR